MSVGVLLMTNWKKLFREFYDDNECGGSSRWLVAPNIVEMFIDFQLRESLEEYKRKNKDGNTKSGS